MESNMPALKVKEFPGFTRSAPETIEKNEMEQALHAAQFKFDRMLHDLRSEFIARESKLRNEYLAEDESGARRNGSTTATEPAIRRWRQTTDSLKQAAPTARCARTQPPGPGHNDRGTVIMVIEVIPSQSKPIVHRPKVKGCIAHRVAQTHCGMELGNPRSAPGNRAPKPGSLPQRFHVAAPCDDCS
jgi:hypothetical protein